MTLRTRVKAAVVAVLHSRHEAERRRLKQVDGVMATAVWDLDVNSAGHLAVCGHDAVELARRYGTPLHVVSRPKLQKDFSRFAAAFRRDWPNVEVGYSYKTNPLPGVISELHAMGAWAEVISHFELWLALKLRVPPDRVIYNGPAKSIEGLHLAISRGIGLINVD